MTVVIGQHIDREGPGIIAEVLESYKIPYRIVDLNKERLLNSGQVRAAVVMGGPQSANDDTPGMYNEVQDVKTIIKDGTPYLGVCLGMQILGKAAGGTVRKNAVKEIGWYDPEESYFQLDMTPEGGKDRIFDGIEDPLCPIFHLHGETVDPSPKTKVLATAEYCKTQVVKIGPKAYGFQGHLEATADMLERWLNEDPDLKGKTGAVRLNNDRLIDVYDSHGRRIITNWLKIAGLVL